jgi:hypothetical protein
VAENFVALNLHTAQSKSKRQAALGTDKTTLQQQLRMFRIDAKPCSESCDTTHSVCRRPGLKNGVADMWLVLLMWRLRNMRIMEFRIHVTDGNRGIGCMNVRCYRVAKLPR